MAKKIIRLTESDLTNIVKRIIKEQNELNSEEVFEIQTALNDYFKMKNTKVNGKPFKIQVDSKWGKETTDALRMFQRGEKIKDDGKVGPETYTAFRKLGLNQNIIEKIIDWIFN
jgi:peptidoglycan hydrolase-like protein with peptidoglycan-binding domain